MQGLFLVLFAHIIVIGFGYLCWSTFAYYRYYISESKLEELFNLIIQNHTRSEFYYNNSSVKYKLVLIDVQNYNLPENQNSNFSDFKIRSRKKKVVGLIFKNTWMTEEYPLLKIYISQDINNNYHICGKNINRKLMMFLLDKIEYTTKRQIQTYGE